MFCKRLKKLRTDKNLTHQQMADFLGVTRQAYGNYENGKREPDFETVKRLADFFEVSVNYLLGSSNSPSPPSPKTKKLYDAIYRAEELPEENIEQVADALEALIKHHKEKTKNQKLNKFNF
jgi:transcriptional regulator with XRE-family HTH domain